MKFLIIFLFVSPCFGWQLPDAPQPRVPTFREEIKQPRYDIPTYQWQTAPTRPSGFNFGRFADHWVTRMEKRAPTETAIARGLVKNKHGAVRAIGRGIKVQKDHLPVQPRPF